MKQKLFSYLGFAGMLTSMLTGCGFVVEEEPLSILGITSQVLEDGQTMVVITYTDEEIPPTVFYLPKGQDGQIGKDGTGIASFDYKKDNYGNYDVEIKFTDDSIEPVKLKLTNGVSISNIGTKYNEEKGVTELIVYYSDGTSSEPLTLPKGDKGEKGEDGVGITEYLQISNEDGSSQLLFAMSDGQIYTCDIPAPIKGKDGVDGRGISSVVSYEEGDYYCISITYTDSEEPQVLKFDKPKQWIVGDENPTDTIGRNGDFYYNNAQNKLFLKVNGKWESQVDLDDLNTFYTVSFNLNASDAEFVPGLGYASSYEIQANKSFATSEGKPNVPVAQRDGYEFAGWYTTPSNVSVTHGSFTNLTIVTGDLELFAKWIPEE